MDVSSFSSEDQMTNYVHAGVTPDPLTGAITKPIYQSTTYVQESVEQYLQKGYSYSRSGNPTVRALEERMKTVEKGADAACFSTGMAATVTVLTAFLSAGDHCIMPICLYGGSYRAANEYVRRFGVEFDFVDFREPAQVEKAFKPNTKMVFAETPANPTLHLTDLAAIDMIIAKKELERQQSNKKATESSSSSEDAVSEEELLKSLSGGKREKERSILFVVDSTFATPEIIHPFEYGADIILHSTTKYFDGHNITTGGAAISRFIKLHDKIAYTRNICGSIMDPQTAFYTLNSSMTLPLRIQRQSKRLMNTVGKPFSLCENLGSAQSLITCPAVFTHAQLTPEQRLAIGVTDGYIRLSIGLESPKDLVEALDKADGYIRLSIGLESPKDLVEALDKALKDLP
ncbi:cystathionine beta-lyase, putative [Eimeria mitis]|uniref:Cystathionine beta-lyase, putative n=1 Tax=Eimeria mitis TaxID=44415 RepID=U6JU93_9EIME|nr:cystathionine beta-lyase, putative [Eimeria mitis]CDJ28969.1 cystathionine beta-lyase, putative [Eimeria mitis]